MSSDERTHALLTRAAELPGPPLIAPVTELVARARRQRRWRQGGLVVVVAAAVAAAVVVPALLIGGATHGARPANHRHGSPAPIPTSTSYPATGSGSASALAAGHWSTLPRAPITGRGGAASVWTGSQWLIWGGAVGGDPVQLLADGAVYTPATRRWTMLPAGPLQARSEAAVVWTGHEMFVWGGYDQLGVPPSQATADGAMYDPATQSWRQLPPSPLSARAGATAVWTGREVVVSGGETAGATTALQADDDDAARGGAAFDPATDKWHMLAPLRVPSGAHVYDSSEVAASGAVYEWVAWYRDLTDGTQVTGLHTAISLDRYDPTSNRWTVIHATGSLPTGIEGPHWTGSELLMPGSISCQSSCPDAAGTFGWRYGVASNRWTAIARGPGDLFDSDSVWTGKALLGYDNDSFIGGGGFKTVRPGDAEVWAPDTNRWYRLPRAPYVGDASDNSVWTGSQLLIWGQMSRPTGHQDKLGPLQTVGLSFG